MNPADFEEALLSAEICFKLTQNSDNSALIHAPVTLKPTPFSSRAFHRACQLQPAYNLLVLRTIQKGVLLRKVCLKLAESDKFVANLFEVYCKYPDPPKVGAILCVCLL